MNRIASVFTPKALYLEARGRERSERTPGDAASKNLRRRRYINRLDYFDPTPSGSNRCCLVVQGALAALATLAFEMDPLWGSGREPKCRLAAMAEATSTINGAIWCARARTPQSPAPPDRSPPPP